MLKYLFTKRFFMSTLGVFILFVTGCFLYMHHIDKQTQQEVERTTEQINKREAAQKQGEKASVEKTGQGGHSHGDGTGHGESTPVEQPLFVDDLKPVPPVPAVTDTGEYKVPINWDELSQEERTRIWNEAYRAKWGDEPSRNGEYRHIYDKKGRIRRHYENKALLTDYETRIGFAPPPNVLQQYQQLQAEYRSAEDAGDTLKTESLLAVMQKLVYNYQGVLPARPYSYATYGNSFSPEDGIPHKEEATRELYQLMGIEHLFEFYERQFFNNNQ